MTGLPGSKGPKPVTDRRSSVSAVRAEFELRRLGLRPNRVRQRLSYSNSRIVWLWAAVLVVLPSTARAHLVNTGFGPFYDGISHLFLSPDELLGVLGWSLLAGLGGARMGRWMLVTLPCAWMAGGLIGVQSASEVGLPLVTALGLLLVGVLVALDCRLPLAVGASLACAFGGLEGFFNGSVAAQGELGLTGLLGIAVTVFVMVSLLAALAITLNQRLPWTRVGVRVAGSWVAAIGLLMAGWALR